ncbi:MAG: hypothetical protein Ct9H90mP13_11690 [Pseudomonadota bacterium]|nr:MAG: hypothetical protein Ct9H90mP13_11690 [Pseudomonadota bacterium]
MQLGGGQMLPEFEEALKDSKPNDEKDFEVHFLKNTLNLIYLVKLPTSMSK